MIKETDLIKLPILNKEYERVNYDIENVIYSFKNFKLLGLYLQNKNLSKDKKVIPYTKIKNVIEEGVIVSSSSDIIDLESISKIKDAIDNYRPIIGYEIYSNKSEILGIVKDVLLQIKTGRVIGLIMSEGIFDDLANGYSFLPLVKDFNFEEYKIILKDNENLEILHQQGGLKKMLGIYKEN